MKHAQSAGLSHIDGGGRLRMVDVGGKPVTQRSARAEGFVRISAALARAIRSGGLEKGDLLATARLAGIQAAKRTAELIPLCHPLPLDWADVQAHLRGRTIAITAEVRTTARTGAEMEALTAVAVAALTVIDMGKAVDRAMVIDGIRVLSKTGGTKKGDIPPFPVPEKPLRRQQADLPALRAAGKGGMSPFFVFE